MHELFLLTTSARTLYRLRFSPTSRLDGASTLGRRFSVPFLASFGQKARLRGAASGSRPEDIF